MVTFTTAKLFSANAIEAMHPLKSKEQHKPVVVMCNKSYDINLVKCLQNYKENRTPNKTIGKQRDNSLIGILTKRNKKNFKKNRVLMHSLKTLF